MKDTISAFIEFTQRVPISQDCHNKVPQTTRWLKQQKIITSLLKAKTKIKESAGLVSS